MGVACEARKSAQQASEQLGRPSQAQRARSRSATYVGPEILPLTLRFLFRFPCEMYMRGTFIAALLSRHLENELSTGDTIQGSVPRRARLVGSRAEDASDVQRRLERLMPYEEWCATLKPTEAGKELYLFVRARLELRVAEAQERARNAAAQPRRRSRKAKPTPADPEQETANGGR